MAAALVRHLASACGQHHVRWRGAPERAEQERSEAPALAVEVVQVVLFSTRMKTALRQIFCFFLCVPGAGVYA